MLEGWTTEPPEGEGEEIRTENADLRAEVARLTRERDRARWWHKRYADKSAALAARVSELEAALRDHAPCYCRDYPEGEKCKRCAALSPSEPAPAEPDLGEPSPPLACPECGWRFGAAEPKESTDAD